MELSVPKVDKIFRHFKGGYYLVLEIAVNTETGEDLVIYRSIVEEDGRVWARPIESWMKSVVLDSGKEVPRFVEVDPLTGFGNCCK